MQMLFIFLFATNIAFAINPNEGIQVYHKYTHLSPQHKQQLADDLTHYQNAGNLWDILREEFSLPHYEEHPEVQEKIQWFMNNQDFLLRSATRASPYLYFILQQVKKRHLPAELVLLPIIESGYNPFGMSRVGAVGMWQLMPNTATGLGVKQNLWYDGRRDIITSTQAALNHLAYLQNFFEGNWLYACAAYNTEEGNVLSAIKRNIRAGRKTDFWSLPIAQETKDYVPSLLALAIIISNPERYPIYFPPVQNAPYLAEVDVGTEINLKYAASLAGMTAKDLLRLNAGFNRSTTSNKGTYKLVLPIENVIQFTENLARMPNNHQINWLHYQIKSGDTVTSIAEKFNITPNEIRKLNHLTSINELPRGLNIIIPTTFASYDAAIEHEEKVELMPVMARVKKPKKSTSIVAFSFNKETAANYQLQPGDTIYMTRPNDTLDEIAKRYHINAKWLQAINQLANNNITSGKQLIIPTHEPTETVTHTNSKRKVIQPGDTIYMVRKGDTIEKIAQKFHTTPAAIRVANLINDQTLVVGENILVPVLVGG